MWGIKLIGKDPATRIRRFYIDSIRYVFGTSPFSHWNLLSGFITDFPPPSYLLHANADGSSVIFDAGVKLARSSLCMGLIHSVATRRTHSTPEKLFVSLNEIFREWNETRNGIVWWPKEADLQVSITRRYFSVCKNEMEYAENNSNLEEGRSALGRQ